MKRIGILLAVVLTARLGVVNYNGHTETWYNLPMNKVIENTDEAFGMTGLYWEREDGCKMYGPWVICAAHPSVTRYSLVETSRGTGIVLDRHTVDNKDLYDLAVTWEKDEQ